MSGISYGHPISFAGKVRSAAGRGFGSGRRFLARSSSVGIKSQTEKQLPMTQGANIVVRAMVQVALILTLSILAAGEQTAFALEPPCSKIVVTERYLSDLRELAVTPSRIDRAGPVYVRRGDEFRLPHIHAEAAGDKLRQVLLILLDQFEAIRTAHGGLITTYTGAESPQGIFVATAAKALGLDVLIGFGGNSVSQSLHEHVLLRKCADLGCRMEVLSKSGYNTVLRARINELLERENLSGKMIKCGMADCELDVGSLRLLQEFLDVEVRSIPSKVQNLVIPAGTGNSAGLLIRSLIRNQRKFNRVIVVQNQNLNHRSTIDQIIGQAYPYEYATYGNVPYQKWVNVDVALEGGGRLALDGRVEAKVWEWMMKNLPVHEEPTLFWNIADTAALREK